MTLLTFCTSFSVPGPSLSIPLFPIYIYFTHYSLTLMNLVIRSYIKGFLCYLRTSTIFPLLMSHAWPDKFLKSLPWTQTPNLYEILNTHKVISRSVWNEFKIPNFRNDYGTVVVSRHCTKQLTRLFCSQKLSSHCYQIKLLCSTNTTVLPSSHTIRFKL